MQTRRTLFFTRFAITVLPLFYWAEATLAQSTIFNPGNNNRYLFIYYGITFP